MSTNARLAHPEQAPTARIVPFPLDRRIGMIRRIARRAADARDPERLILDAVRRAAGMARGLDPETLEDDLDRYEVAIRALVARCRYAGRSIGEGPDPA